MKIEKDHHHVKAAFKRNGTPPLHRKPRIPSPMSEPYDRHRHSENPPSPVRIWLQRPSTATAAGRFVVNAPLDPIEELGGVKRVRVVHIRHPSKQPLLSQQERVSSVVAVAEIMDKPASHLDSSGRTSSLVQCPFPKE